LDNNILRSLRLQPHKLHPDVEMTMGSTIWRCAMVAAAILAGCSGQQNDSTRASAAGEAVEAPAPVGQPAPAEPALVMTDKPIETPEKETSEALPAGVAEAPYATCIGADPNTFCDAQQKSFIRDWAKAWRADYQAQRNVGFCLSTGCDGAAQLNKTQGCAWYTVIIASGSERVDDTDTANVRLYCGRLDQVELMASREQARRIFRKVYRRDLPERF
jgi:hypothetical protein